VKGEEMGDEEMEGEKGTKVDPSLLITPNS
jgi:hypothetical protein